MMSLKAEEREKKCKRNHKRQMISNVDCFLLKLQGRMKYMVFAIFLKGSGNEESIIMA